MSLILRIKSGPLEGKVFPLMDGSILGRGDVDISVPDGKISTQHAQISRDPQGAWVMRDLGSTNGLRVSGKRLAQVTLSVGTEVLVGHTYFDVLVSPESIETSASVERDNSPPPLNNAPEEPPLEDATQPPLPNNVELEKQDWNEYLAAYANMIAADLKAAPKKELQPFAPNLILTFTRGMQVGTEWTLGYGPRLIGLDGVDLPLFDPTAPTTAFVVTPKGHLAHFSAPDPTKVRLNGKNISSDELKSGDEIIIGNTHIRVGYRE